jgi:Outer membrane protein beta-barrel domain
MKFVAALVALLSFALTAAAEDSPGFEAYFGYDWVKFNPDTPNIPSFNANGGSAQLIYNFYHGVGLAFDGGAVTKSTFSNAFDNWQAHFLLGPRFGFHNHSRFTPFGEVLFGASEASVSTSVANFPLLPTVNPLTSITVPSDVSVRLTASRTSFAMMAGGGLDIRLAKHFTYRLFDADYYLTRPVSFLSGENVNKNNFRVTTGVALTWGEAR